MAALPAGFPKPPQPPPATEPFGSKAWVDYLTDLYQWQIKLVDALS